MENTKQEGKVNKIKECGCSSCQNIEEIEICRQCDNFSNYEPKTKNQLATEEYEDSFDQYREGTISRDELDKQINSTLEKYSGKDEVEDYINELKIKLGLVEK